MSLVDTAKDIYDLLKKGATIELQEKLMRLREDALALQEENIGLKEYILKLERRIEEKTSLIFDGRVYWKKIDENEKDGPFCQSCYDLNGQAIRLQLHRVNIGHGQVSEFWSCNICNNNYDSK